MEVRELFARGFKGGMASSSGGELKCVRESRCCPGGVGQGRGGRMVVARLGWEREEVLRRFGVGGVV